MAAEDGLDALPFDIEMGVAISGRYESNVFATENAIEDDFLTVIAPSLTLSKQGPGWSVALGGEGEIGRHLDFDRENYADGILRAEGRVTILPELTLFGGGDFGWAHEARTSPDDADGLEPTRYRDASAFAGVSGRRDDLTWRLGGTVRMLDFDDTPRLALPDLDNQDRDRTEAEWGARLGHFVAPGTQVFVQGIQDVRRYDRAVDDNGFRRDSRGLQGAIGATGSLGPVTGEVLAGLLHRSYDDPAFDAITTFDLGAELTWRPSRRTTLVGSLERSIEETTLAGASGYVATQATVKLLHRVAPDLSAQAWVGVGRDSYHGISRNDTLLEAGLGLRHHLTPSIWVGGSYAFAQRNSDVAGADYDTHAVTVSLGADLAPAWDADAEPLLAEIGSSGFYIGIQGGDGVLMTALEGPRGNGGLLVADFGDTGQSVGLVAGWRMTVDGLVLGIEGEAEFGWAEWTHLANRDFGVTRGDSFGGSLILGREMSDGTVLFGRVGAVSTAFEGTYRRGGAIGRFDDRETGLRIGAGAEVPVGGGLSARLDYVVTSYGDYLLGAPTGTATPDRFANAEATARLALIYHLGARDLPADDSAPTDFSGFYAGLQGGHGALVSRNIGPRPDAPAPQFTLDAMRAGHGLTAGVFAGYGESFGRFYLGAEIEAELSTQDWNVERDPTGRVFSVEKRGAIGAGLRAGYQLGDRTLAYLRGGIVGTRIDTSYAFGGAVVESQDVLWGPRIGGGLEIAATDRVRVRLDYSRSFSGSHSIAYPTGTDRFDTSDQQFRIGVALSF